MSHKKAHKAKGSRQERGDGTPISREQLVVAASRISLRLSRHLDVLDAGHMEAVDDVAAVLRTLLAHGEGDRLLRRICRTFNVEQPRFFVSGPATDDPSVILAAGGLPMPNDFQESSSGHPGRWVAFDSWIDSSALIVRGAQRRKNTWNQVITTYANTYGSHVSTSIPAMLSRTALFRSAEYDLGAFMIRAAGILGENALRQVLPVVGGGASLSPVERQVRLEKTAFCALRISRKNSRNIQTEIGFHTWKEDPTAHLLTVPLENGSKLTLNSGPDGVEAQMVDGNGRQAAGLHYSSAEGFEIPEFPIK